MKKLVAIFLIFIQLHAETFDYDIDSITKKILLEPQKPLTQKELQERVIYTNLAAVGVVTLWGTLFWDYFTISPIAADEDWFAEDTKYGGADKLGHVYSTYILSLGFASLFEHWGMDKEDSLLYGPLSAWIFQAGMEIGDSFSATQGFAYEDIVMNSLGAGFYYLRERYPALKDTVDMRLEYLPAFREGDEDIFTQYNNKKYLLALKFSGFENTNSSFLKYGELQLGYYTRGYKNNEFYLQKERTAYIGAGINVAEVLKSLGWIKTSKIFNYIQLPYTYLPLSCDLNSADCFEPYSRSYHGDYR